MNTEAESRVRELLLPLAEDEYRVFNARILATVPPEKVMGVRTPGQRRVAKAVYCSEYREAFLSSLPHDTFEENQVHGFLIEQEKDRSRVIALLEDFLPYVDNWATCDCVSPKVFKKEPPDLDNIRNWMDSGHVYTCRFGIGMLMRYYLDERFDEEYLNAVAAIRSDAYYVNMMRAWFFATALTKQYDRTLPYMERRVLDPWTHNKAIQKARESYCVPMDHKAYLDGLRHKKNE